MNLAPFARCKTGESTVAKSELVCYSFRIQFAAIFRNGQLITVSLFILLMVGKTNKFLWYQIVTWMIVKSVEDYRFRRINPGDWFKRKTGVDIGKKLKFTHFVDLMCRFEFLNTHLVCSGASVEYFDGRWRQICRTLFHKCSSVHV